MSPADPTVLYGVQPLECDEPSEPNVFRASYDGGETFAEFQADVALSPLLAHPVDPFTLLAAGCDGIYLSSSGGETWFPLSTAPDEELWSDVRAVQMVAAYTMGVDDEPQWAALYVVAADEKGQSVILYSPDQGRTWSQISPDLGDTPFFISSLAADPANVGRLWAAEKKGVWTTEDQGQFWGFTNRGLEDVVGGGLNAILHHPDDIVFLATSAGLYYKQVEATRWVETGDDQLAAKSIDSMLLTDSAPTQLWLNTSDGVFLHSVEP
jgi:photosystem II stability/assembly factor-like uncharacterized protein